MYWIYRIALTCTEINFILQHYFKHMSLYKREKDLRVSTKRGELVLATIQISLTTQKNVYFSSQIPTHQLHSTVLIQVIHLQTSPPLFYIRFPKDHDYSTLPPPRQ